MISNKDVEYFTESIADAIVSEFEKCDYPNVPLHLKSEYFEIEIRTPHQIPSFLLERHCSIHEKVKSCPSIEVIKITEELQRKGLLTKIIKKLESVTNVECICISNVSNIEFSNYLSKKEEWIELPRFLEIGLKSFYKMCVQ